MIELKELITENIIFSVSWKYESDKYYVYLTKTKLYEYCYDEQERRYWYSVYLVKDFGHMICRPRSQRPQNYADCACHGFITICQRHGREGLASFKFPCTEEGAKAAEKLYIALSKVME